MTTYEPASSSGPGVQVQLGAGDKVIVDSGVDIVSTTDIAVADSYYGSADIAGTVNGAVEGIGFGDAQPFDIINIEATGVAEGIRIGADLGEGNARLTNDGNIFSTGITNGSTVSAAISSTPLESQNIQYIINSGTVSGYNGIEVDGKGTVQIINSGSITGTNAAIDTTGSEGNSIYIRNDGTINGNVELNVIGVFSLDSSDGTLAGNITADRTGNCDIIAGLTGGAVTTSGGDDNLQANQSQIAANNTAHFTLDGGQGTNALYGGGAYNTFMAGDANGGFNQIHGSVSLMSGVSGYSNNMLSFEDTPSGESVYVDLLKGHNAFVNSNATNTGFYSLEDAIANVPNIIGSAGADIIIDDNGTDRTQGGGGADQLHSGTGADTFVYSTYADSNTATGYDVITGFQTGLDKLDLSAFKLSASHLIIASNATSTSLYLEQTAGHFNASTDLAISFKGTHAVSASDVIF